jgi:thiamine biosynthesis lipoprotein
VKLASGIARNSVLIGASALLLACNGAPVTYELVGSTMGTSFNVQVVSPPASVDADALRQEISETLAAIEQSMSTYLPDSELSRFNAQASGEWFNVSASLCSVVEGAQDISRRSEGAFDVTVGALVNLWGFGPQQAIGEPPEPARIASLLRTLGNDKLQTDCTRPALRKDAADIYVDLSGYAKGYGVDQVAELLSRAGIGNYLVEIGGEVRARGRNARDTEWAIAIESPQRDSRSVARIVPLSDAAMATSGDYRIYFESAGVFYSHTIDPRSGYPVSHDAAAVTVIADTAAFADGMATALLVLGPVAGLRLAESENIAALFQLRVGDAINERMSTRFRREVALN